ncbi:MAG: hypothetical protein M0R03_08180 [Novosphingobium sp.]|nr:hypothetical protein [Novosphingobium sp.]
MALMKLINRDTSAETILTPRPLRIDGWYQEEEVNEITLISGKKKYYKRDNDVRQMSFVYENLSTTMKNSIINFFEAGTRYYLVMSDIPELEVTIETQIPIIIITKPSASSQKFPDETVWSVSVRFDDDPA